MAAVLRSMSSVASGSIEHIAHRSLGCVQLQNGAESLVVSLLCFGCREMALELVSEADFWCKLMSGVRPVDLRGSRGR